MPEKSESIETIWIEVRSGSAEAWSALVRLLAPVVYSVPRRWGLDRSDSEDISQQTWFALYKSRDKIEDPVALPAWLINVASRKSKRLIRGRIRSRDIPASGGADLPPLPDEEILSLERQAYLRLALTRLDSRCRKLVEALFLSHPPKPYRQIAKELGLKPNSLGPVRTRCLERLKKIFEDFGF